MIELQVHHYMTPEPANKLSLQELNYLIVIKLLTSGFKIFGSLTQFPGEGKCPLFLLADTHGCHIKKRKGKPKSQPNQQSSKLKSNNFEAWRKK